jgi:hypothetical protein
MLLEVVKETTLNEIRVWKIQYCDNGKKEVDLMKIFSTLQSKIILNCILGIGGCEKKLPQYSNG